MEQLWCKMDSQTSQIFVVLERRNRLEISTQRDEYMHCTRLKDGDSSADFDLHDAILAGKINSVRRILTSEECSLDGDGFEIDPPILTCLYAEHTIFDKDSLCGQIINLLIQAGADTNVRVKFRLRKTAAMIAAEKGLLRVLEVLTENGADLSAKCRCGRTALMYAFNNDQLHCAKYLLDHRYNSEVTSLVIEEDYLLMIRYLTLYYSESHDKASLCCEILKLFVQAGADINARDSLNDKTGAMIAAGEGFLQILEILTENGADLSVERSEGQTALTYAIKSDQLHCTKYLLDHMSNSEIARINKQGDPLINQCLKADYEPSHDRDSLCCEIIKLLIKAGVDINARELSTGITAAMVAAENGLIQCLQLLHQCGADLSCGCDRGWTALMLALDEDHLECTHYLLDNMSLRNINSRNFRGETALFIAAEKGNEVCVSILLKNGIKVDTTNSEGDTALVKALLERNPAVFKLLLDHGATLNFDDAGCYRFLYRFNNFRPVSELNIFQSHSSSLLSWIHCRLLHLAIIMGYSYTAYPLVKYLILRGCAPIDLKISEHVTTGACFMPTRYRMISPLALALTRGHLGIAEYFIVNRFFTKFDIQQACWYNEFREGVRITYNLDNKDTIYVDSKVIESFNTATLFCSGPQSLFTLSVVTISSALTQDLSSDLVFKAEDRDLPHRSYREKVEDLPLPPALKRVLKFQTANSTICCNTWYDLHVGDTAVLPECHCKECTSGDNVVLGRYVFF